MRFDVSSRDVRRDLGNTLVYPLWVSISQDYEQLAEILDEGCDVLGELA